MQKPLLKNVTRIETEEMFSFLCYPGVSCFTHCCRQLELSLTPYDVLRLKNATGLTSSAFLEKFVIIEQENSDTFPRLYLTMIDDGNASCVFVSDHGCTVYEDRPGACRAYPMGRAAMLTEQDTIEDFYVLLKEDHCHGFDLNQRQTPTQYCQEQGLSFYNHINDAVAVILQHEKVRQGMALSKEQIGDYILSLYDLDTFRKMIATDQLPHIPLNAAQRQELERDEPMLLFAIDWLKNSLFAND
jgi:uncharacterized protein